MTDAPDARPGEAVPDHRGRTGLHTTGLGLDRNPDVRVTDVELIAAPWHVLRRTTLRVRGPGGEWETQQRETYDRGNGATILLYDLPRRRVLLTRQFRYPVYANEHPDGMLLETAAGLLDDDDPATAIRREAAEETGVEVGELEHVWDVYMSPGSVTERIHFFAAPYDSDARTTDRGGLADEGEHIDLVEVDIDDALEMMRTGGIQDAKTMMLLQWSVLEGPFAPPARPRREK
jgi:nudix-type nucleoside diphosphatase (YffH/AdpP family)